MDVNGCVTCVWDGCEWLSNMSLGFRLLGEPTFMEQLLNFDKEKMDARRVRMLQKYIEMPGFTPEQVGSRV